MPGLDRYAVLRSLGPTAPPVVLISGGVIDETAFDAKNVTRVLTKPFDQTDLLATVVLPSAVPPDDILKVGIKTSGPATYSWIHRTGNGTTTRLTTQTGPTLNFKDVIRLKGYYLLTITTGVTTRTLTFQVLSFATTNIGTGGVTAPAITYDPESLTVPLGGAAAFAVTASGSVRGYVWWKKVGAVETALTAVGSSPWLALDKVALTDEASYYAEVFSADPLGASVKSAQAVLEVVPAGE
jgi:CheY-like chemotaxis protein